MTLCTQCDGQLVPEDALYDDRTYAYFCDNDCFRDWADDNNEEVVEFYERLNISGG